MPRALDITTSVDEDGQLPKTRSEQLRNHLKLFAGGKVRIRVGRPKRTNQANKFYWSCVITPIQEAMIDAGIGYMETNDGIKTVTALAIHTFFKHKYIPPQSVVLFGEDVVLPPSTTKLDQTEFSDYIERIRTDPMVLQLNPHFPEPEDTYKSYSLDDLPY